MGIFWKGKHIFQNLEVAPGGIFKGFGHVDPGGRVYYVNNITGSSGAGGLSWNDACDQLATARALSEAYRKIGGSARTVDTNDYVRNTIVMQGTGTAYDECLVFPNYANVIGLGANPFGYGGGIARLGLDLHTNPTVGGGLSGGGDDDDCRGSYFWNLQFQAANGYSAVKVKDIFRTTFEDCALFASGNPVQPPDCGFEITGSANGLKLINCRTGTNSGKNSEPNIGLNINGVHFQNCEVVGGFYGGNNVGIYVASSLVYGWGSTIHDLFVGEGSEQCLIGIDDDSSPGTIHYYNIFINANDPIEPGDDDTRYIGCISSTDMVKT